MRGQLRFLQESGFEVIVVSSPGPRLLAAAAQEGVQICPISIPREISPLRDLVSLIRISRLTARFKPTITNVSTPKAGLLAGIASFICGVPCKVYTLRGLRFETATGWKRRLLVLSEKLACRCADRVVCVSHSVRHRALQFELAPPEKLLVLREGSSNGVDVQRFAPSLQQSLLAKTLRESLKISSTAPVIGFVGRITRDKGISILVQAYTMLKQRFPNLCLLLVGEYESEDSIPDEINAIIRGDSDIVTTGAVEDVAGYYHLMDVFALPTYREGFPNSVLEAQAAAKPVVTTNATGAVDSVVDGLTGIVVSPGDEGALAEALSSLLADKDRAQTMGLAGYERVSRTFRQQDVWSALRNELCSLLNERGLPSPATSDCPQVSHTLEASVDTLQ
jgi:glycosyltransferase involved in cell wall biosynthesis